MSSKITTYSAQENACFTLQCGVLNINPIIYLLMGSPLPWANYLKPMTDFEMLHLSEVFWKRKISGMLILGSHCLILMKETVRLQTVIDYIR